MALVSITLIVCVALTDLTPHALWGLLITWIPDVVLLMSLAGK